MPIAIIIVIMIIAIISLFVALQENIPELGVPSGTVLVGCFLWILCAASLEREVVGVKQFRVNKIENNGRVVDVIVVEDKIVNLNEKTHSTFNDGDIIEEIKYKKCYGGIHFMMSDSDYTVYTKVKKNEQVEEN